MRYLKTYKIFEAIDNIEDIEDIFHELRDEGYYVKIFPHRQTKQNGSVLTYRIEINKHHNNEYGYDEDNNFQFEKPFIFSEIIDVVDRSLSIIGDSYIVTCDVELYNPYEDKKFNRVFKDRAITWDELNKEMRQDFGLATLVNSLELKLR